MKKVVVVSASWCPQCGPFKKALENAGIEFETLDADDARNEEYLKTAGVRGLPTTLVFEGEVRIGSVVGNHVPKVKELLNQ